MEKLLKETYNYLLNYGEVPFEQRHGKREHQQVINIMSNEKLLIETFDVIEEECDYHGVEVKDFTLAAKTYV